MDDALKLQKLAAARNKLKHHQQKKQKRPETAPADTSTSIVQQNPERTSPAPQLQSYFTGPPGGLPSMPSAGMYFDNISTSSQILDIPNPPSAPPSSDLIGIQLEPDSVSYEDPDINPNEVQEYVNARKQHEDAQRQVQPHQDDQQQNVTPKQEHEHQSGESANISVIEQLRQLNDDISHAVESNGYENYSNFSDLEKRNLELANSYEKERIRSAQLQSDLAEYMKHTETIQRQMEMLRVECDTRTRNELVPLENEIASHRQTLGILVGEKTELSATVIHVQSLLQNKTMECEEAQARLRTSRSRVADLERELTSMKEERGRQAMVLSGHGEEYERLRDELQQSHVRERDLQVDVDEMRERLRLLQEECTARIHKCSEYESRLELANVKIQQLTNGTDPSASERFMQEKVSLEKQILDLNSSLKTAMAEREQANSQYQQYVLQLNGNIANLAEQLESSTIENNRLHQREQELVQHIGDVEKRLQNVQMQQDAGLYKQNDATEPPQLPNAEISILTSKLDELTKANAELEMRHENLRVERDEFIKDVETKRAVIDELEEVVERLRGNQTNGVQLLADIESEKVAASRAVEQNMRLKQQLEEMQDAFIRMTNDKAELLTSLSSLEFRHREMEDHAEQAQHQLRTLTEAIEIKDRELTDMRVRADAADKHALAHDQLNDRLRHYEAHDHSAHALGQELQRARDEMHALNTRNKHLEEMLRARDEMPSTGVITSPPTVQSHSAPPTPKIANVAVPQPVLGSAIHEPTTTVDAAVNPARDESTNTDVPHTSTETAMHQLESKFVRTMEEVANLVDEKQMLEHIVMQLQGETDTIGEYIALYQHQRGVLKQRAIEKETQLKQLTKDREQMKRQLQALNDLVKRLLAENRVSDSVLQAHQEINENSTALCEEHARMHEGMQRATNVVNGDAANREEGSAGNETAQQIIALLGEIKASNLVQPTDISENFHPCPLCSGQLITV